MVACWYSSLYIVVFKVNVFSENDQHSVVMSERYHLSEGHKCKTGRIEGGQTQTEVASTSF